MDCTAGLTGLKWKSYLQKRNQSRPNHGDEIIRAQHEICSGSARRIAGKATSGVDGDTIKVDGLPAGFAMASAPELNEPGGMEDRNFTGTISSMAHFTFII